MYTSLLGEMCPSIINVSLYLLKTDTQLAQRNGKEGKCTTVTLQSYGQSLAPYTW